MKNIFYLLIFVSVLFSCSEESEQILDSNVKDCNIEIEAVNGGAIMHYGLANDSKIYAIEVRYKDEFGEQIISKGTYLNTSIKLQGFINDKEDIPIEIRLLDNKGISSKPEWRKFSVKKCAAKAFMDDLEVKTYWDGFRIEYEGVEDPNGFFHVAHLGINPMTKEHDTLLIQTYPLEKGMQVKMFGNTSDEESNSTSVVVWAEDYRGNFVDKKVFKDVPASKSVLMDPKDFGFEGSSKEDPTMEASWKYLFDGDTKGSRRMEAGGRKSYSFISEKNAVPGFWTVDLKELKILSQVRLYCPLNSPWKHWGHDLWGFDYFFMMPSHVKIYASDDNSLPIDQWTLMGEYQESYGEDYEDDAHKNWNYPFVDPARRYYSVEQLEDAEPCYIKFDIEFSETRYRYIRLEVLDVFHMLQWGCVTMNEDNVLAFHELEVYVKKD